MRSRVSHGQGVRHPEAARPGSRFGPVRGFGVPASSESEPAGPADLLAWQERAERFGHRLTVPQASPEAPPIQAMMRARASSSGSGGGDDRGEKKKDDWADEQALRELLGEEDDDEEEDDGKDEDFGGGKQEKQRQKAKERRDKINANKERGRKVDTSSDIFKLGKMARASSMTGRSLLEKKFSEKKKDIETTTQSIENASPGALSFPGVPPFAVLAGLKNASTVPEGITSFGTDSGTLSRPYKSHRKASVKPGPSRLNTLVVPDLKSYSKISSAKDKPSEKLLETLENERDRSSGETTHIKRKLREGKKLSKAKEKGDEQSTSVMELVGANDNDPHLETLKTQNVGNTINLLDGSDVELAQSTSGVPVLGRHHHQTLSHLAQKPGSPTREDAALLSSFRLARASEDLSGTLSPTPEELQQHRGYSSSWNPPTRETKAKKKREKKKRQKKVLLKDPSHSRKPRRDDSSDESEQKRKKVE